MATTTCDWCDNPATEIRHDTGKKLHLCEVHAEEFDEEFYEDDDVDDVDDDDETSEDDE